MYTFLPTSVSAHSIRNEGTYDNARMLPFSPNILFIPHLTNKRIRVITIALATGAKRVFP